MGCASVHTHEPPHATALVENCSDCLFSTRHLVTPWQGCCECYTLETRVRPHAPEMLLLAVCPYAHLSQRCTARHWKLQWVCHALGLSCWDERTHSHRRIYSVATEDTLKLHVWEYCQGLLTEDPFSTKCLLMCLLMLKWLGDVITILALQAQV